MEQLIQRGWSHEAATQSVEFDRQLDRSWAEHVAGMGEGQIARQHRALAREQSRKQSRKAWTIVVLVGAFLAVLVYNFPTTNPKQESVAAKPAPAISRSLTGINVFAAMEQLQKDGFSLADDTIVIAPWSAAPNCAAPTDADLETVTVKSAIASEGVATLTVQDTRVCPAPAPVVVPVPNVGVPNPNLPNPPRVSSGGGGGGESRFCRKRWWC